MNEQTAQFLPALPTNLSRQAIYDLAQRVASKVGYTPGTPLGDIIKKLGGKIEYQDMAQWYASESGSIEVAGPKDFRIYLSQFTSSARDNFTLAHELGHYVLHSKSGKLPIKVSRYGSDRVEWEANWFAAAFLMPAQEFREAVALGMGEQELAAKFQTSAEAARIRAKELGLAL
jgi:hypothetical protein